MNPTTMQQPTHDTAGDRKSVLRAAGLIGAITLLSRLTGLVRDAILAALFGSGRVLDVYYTAFEMSNLLRRVLGEGALSSFVVPLMSERIHQDGRAAGWRFMNVAANFMFVVALLLTILGMYFSREVFLVFGGYGLLKANAAHYVDLGTRLTRLMFPFVIALTVGSVLMGACHTIRSFGPPSLGSVMLNLTTIAAGGAALMLGTPDEPATVWLAWSVLAGAALRVVIMMPALGRAGWRWEPVFAPRDPHLRRLLRMMVPGLLAMAIGQINLSVSGFFAMYLGAGAKTSIIMAGRLIQFPMALTATAAATAMLPQLSQYLIQGRHDDLRNLLALTKRLEIVLMVPAVAGLMIFGFPIIEMIFHHGRWTTSASASTAWALLFYAPGLLPLGWIRLIEPIFFARHDRVTPLKAAALSVAVNIALNWILAFHSPLPAMGLAPAGLAIANTIAAFVNYYALSWWLGRVLERPMGERPRLGETMWKSLLAAALACGAGAALYHWGLIRLFGDPHGTITRVAMLLPVIALVAAGHLALVRLLRVPDSERATAMILRKLHR